MRPFWIEQALFNDGALAPALQGAQQADLCIVGGGFTGLWTAIQCKQQNPQLDIVILESDLCGAGASGRNGGCLLTWSAKFFTLQRLFGETEAVRLVRAADAAVDHIERFVREHGIEAEFRRDGTLYTATASAQVGSRTVPVYLRVDQPAQTASLRQGLFVQGLLTTGSAQVLTVPLDAVRTDKPAPYLQTIKDGRVAHAPVQTGARAVVNGQTLVAVDGVPVGTTVIAGRMGSLREGTPATAAQAAVVPQASAPAPAQAASRTTP